MADEQDLAELYDEESMGDDETIVEPEPDDGYVHGILGTDPLGADTTAELVATEEPADGPLTAEEAAIHFESH